MPSFASASRAIRYSLIAAATLLFVSAPAHGQANPVLVPYMTSIFAGGGATTTYAAGNLCPVSGYTMTDTLGDGCLATEITIKNPRYVVQDIAGNYFFSEPGNFDIRRIDAVTGIVSQIAGGSSSARTIGAACASGTGTYNTTAGDGCAGAQAYFGRPSGLAINPLNGDLYIADAYTYAVHKLTANTTTALSTTVKLVADSTAVMSLVAGTPTGFGYVIGDPTCPTPTSTSTCVQNQIAETGTTATSSYLDEPVGITFDANGILYIGEEFKEAVIAYNASTTTQVVEGISIPAGDITKLVGSYTPPQTYCQNAPGSSNNGCKFPGTNSPAGTAADGVEIDGALDTVIDSNGKLYFDEYYYGVVNTVSTTNIFTPSYVGTRSSTLSTVSATKRGTGGSFGVGVAMGLAMDAKNNLFMTDAGNGIIWRVDATTQDMYAIGGGGTGTCGGVYTPTNTNGDGCPATNAKFSGYGATTRPTTSPSGGQMVLPTALQGLFFDNHGDLMAADAGNNEIRKLSTGTYFGSVVGHVTDYLDIHFGAGDTPALTSAYVLTAGAANFTLGTASCTTNSTDTTTDCILPVTTAATAQGPFTGTLQVTSAAAKVSSFPLSGTIVVPVASTTVVTVAGTCPPGGVSTITATVSNSVGLPSGGTVTIYVNGVLISTQTLPVSHKVTATYSFPPVANYQVYAAYSGDASDLPSTTTTQAVTTFASSPFTLSIGAKSESSVVAGGTALYTFNVTEFSSGAYQFYCSGLPSGATCIFYPPPPVSLTTCQSTATIALSVTTTEAQPVVYGFGGYSKNKWELLVTLPAILLAMLVMVRRRKSPLKYSGMLLALAFLIAMAGTLGCGAGYGKSAPGTPAGGTTTSFSVTGVDALGNTQTLTGFTLTVN